MKKGGAEPVYRGWGLGDRDKGIRRVQPGDTGKEGRLQFGDREEGHRGGVLPGSRGAGDAGKRQGAEEKWHRAVRREGQRRGPELDLGVQ